MCIRDRPISDTDVAEIHNAFYGTDLEFEIEKELGITWVESINYEDGSVITCLLYTSRCV